MTDSGLFAPVGFRLWNAFGDPAVSLTNVASVDTDDVRAENSDEAVAPASVVWLWSNAVSCWSTLCWRKKYPATLTPTSTAATASEMSEGRQRVVFTSVLERPSLTA